MAGWGTGRSNERRGCFGSDGSYIFHPGTLLDSRAMVAVGEAPGSVRGFRMNSPERKIKTGIRYIAIRF
jgi:hypothetical protein